MKSHANLPNYNSLHIPFGFKVFGQPNPHMSIEYNPTTATHWLQYSSNIQYSSCILSQFSISESSNCAFALTLSVSACGYFALTLHFCKEREFDFWKSYITYENLPTAILVLKNEVEIIVGEKKKLLKESNKSTSSTQEMMTCKSRFNLYTYDIYFMFGLTTK